MPEMDALLIGAINYDVYAPVLANSHETTALSSDISIEIGGGAAITALALATLGLSVGVSGVVGRHSDIIEKELFEKGVHLYLERYDDVETAITIADHDKRGNKRYRANVDSNRRYSRKTLQKLSDQLPLTRVIMRTGYPWMPDIAGQPTADLFSKARAGGVITALDMSNPDSWDTGLLEELVELVIPQTDLLCANEMELYRLANKGQKPETGTSDTDGGMDQERIREYALGLIGQGVKMVNVHRGEKGTALVTDTAFVEEPAHRVNALIHPTGCGNLQNAGVIYGLLKGWELDRAAKLGNYMATQRLGGLLFPKLEGFK